MKNLAFLFSILLFSFSLSAQTASETARAAALKSGMQSGQSAAISGTINYVDEIRKEVGGNYVFRNTDNADTITLLNFPGDAYTSGRTLYAIDILVKVNVTDDTTTSKFFIGFNAAKDSVTLTGLINPFIHYSGYALRDTGGYKYIITQEIVTTDSGESTKVYHTSTFTKTASVPTPLKFWPTDADEVDSYNIFSRVTLLKK